MADLWVDVDTACASVPVNVAALIDDTDFKTRETSVAYNAGGMDLVWNFTTTAGVTTQTAVTPTTSGTYDWTNLGDGMYAIEIPASGGASINNDTEGVGWFTGIATGVLAWRGPFIGFRAAALNNSLIDAGVTGLLAPTTAARTLDVTATGAAGIDWANVENPTTALNLSGTNIDVDQIVASVSGAVGSVTGAVGSVTGAVGSVTGNVGGNVTGSVGSVVGAVGSVTGNVGGNVVGTVASVVGAVGSVTGNVGGNVTGSVGSVVGAVGSVTGAVGSVTGNVGGNVTGTVASVVGNVGGNVTGSVGSVVAVVSANIKKINDTTILGDGAGTPWGPV